MKNLLLKLAKKDSSFRKKLIIAMRRKKEVDTTPKWGTPAWKEWELKLLSEAKRVISNLKWTISDPIEAGPSILAKGIGEEKYLEYRIFCNYSSPDHWWITVFYTGPKLFVDPFYWEEGEMFSDDGTSLQEVWKKVQRILDLEYRKSMRKLLTNQKDYR